MPSLPSPLPLVHEPSSVPGSLAQPPPGLGEAGASPFPDGAEIGPAGEDVVVGWVSAGFGTVDFEGLVLELWVRVGGASEPHAAAPIAASAKARTTNAFRRFGPPAFVLVAGVLRSSLRS